MTTLRENGHIINNKGIIVGNMCWNGNVFIDIFIQPKYRGNGHAKKSVKQLITYIKQNKYNYIKTKPVLNSTMETILKKYQFVPEKELKGEFIDYIETDNELTTPQNQKVNNKNCWIKIL